MGKGPSSVRPSAAESSGVDEGVGWAVGGPSALDRGGDSGGECGKGYWALAGGSWRILYLGSGFKPKQCRPPGSGGGRLNGDNITTGKADGVAASDP